LIETKRRLLSVKSSEIKPSEAQLNGTQVTVAKKDKDLFTHLYGAILDVCVSVDASKGLSEESALETLEMLLRDFYYLKYEEFLLVFRMMKEGKFGNFYERLKAAEFTRCFEEYDKDEARSARWERANKSKKIEPHDKLETTKDKVEFYKRWAKAWADKIDTKERQSEAEKEYNRIREAYNEGRLNDV